MISNKIMSKIESILMSRLLNGLSPSITIFPNYLEDGSPIDYVDSEKIFKSVNSQMKVPKNKDTVNFDEFIGIRQVFNGVEYTFEYVYEIGGPGEMMISISPASIVQVLTDISFNDIHSVKEYMKEALNATDVQIKITY